MYLKPTRKRLIVGLEMRGVPFTDCLKISLSGLTFSQSRKGSPDISPQEVLNRHA